MITFLEFVCEKTMGPPVYARSWRCPFHDDNSPSFAVNPPKQRPDGGWFPIKFKCHAGSCMHFGDEWDILSRFFPEAKYAAQLKRMKAWALEYERLFGITPEISSKGFLSPGQRGEDAEQLKYCAAELRSVIRDRGLEWSEDVAGFKVLLWADAIASENGVTLEAFVRQAVSELIKSSTSTPNSEHKSRNSRRTNSQLPWMREIPPVAANLRQQATLTIEFFNDHRVKCYPCENLKRDLKRLRVEEKSYGCRLTSPRDNMGHGDTFSAFALALLMAHEFAGKDTPDWTFDSSSQSLAEQQAERLAAWEADWKAEREAHEKARNGGKSWMDALADGTLNYNPRAFGLND